MDKLSIWDSEHILDKISLCTLEKGQKIENGAGRDFVIFDDGREQEVLHIFIDMSRSREGNIRRSTK